ncbi:MAG: hypothetical protein L3J36_05170 [Rhodobacteraceae bacterium]|nr:hypothetical protein [Paracoccaceae bacterium]
MIQQTEPLRGRQIGRQIAFVALMLTLIPGAALAHASEQGFVLLLPTGVYILAGTTAVALTIFLVAVVPGGALKAAFRPRNLMRARAHVWARHAASCLSLALLSWLIWVGWTGPGDPLSNPLPLFVWTLWWVGFVTLQGLFANFWAWVNPWTGPVAVTRALLNLRPFLRLPASLGSTPALVTFLALVSILLADPAPADPHRLAGYVFAYWLFTYLAMLAFGPRWRYRGDGIAVLMRVYSQMNLFGRAGPAGRHVVLGLPGWQVSRRAAPPFGVAVFILVLLGSGSFDGLNETFWWLDILGLNPLEFPGRSAVIGQTLIGLFVANLALIAVFVLSIRLGLMLVQERGQERIALMPVFCLFAPSILPIALGYHIAHYLPGFLVNAQYALAAASDPMGTGADLLGLGQFYVTTGFFNSQNSVRVIWLSQAGAVVGGHILAVMLAHTLAVRQFREGRKAVLVGVPLALFMVLYTLFGLWLLASPRGV